MWLLLETNCQLFFLPLSLFLSFVNKYEANPSAEAQPRPKCFNFLSTNAPGHSEWSWTIKCLGKVNKYGCNILVFSHGTSDVAPHNSKYITLSWIQNLNTNTTNLNKSEHSLFLILKNRGSKRCSAILT